MIAAGDTSVFVRWLVIMVLSAATLVMVGVSLRANYLFGYGFGQSEDKAQLFGLANVAADLWKISGLIVITSLWRAGQKRFALLLFPIWALCLLWGLVAAIGIYAQDRSALIGGREAKGATYDDLERELTKTRAALRALGRQRTPEQVDATIAARLAEPIKSGRRLRGTVGSLSHNCTKHDWRTAAVCLEIARLRQERAASVEAERLKSREQALQADMFELRATGATLPADPVAELFAWLSGGQLKVRDIAFGFPLVFAVLIEIVSAFGPAAITAYAEATRRRGEPGASLPEPALADLAEPRRGLAGRGGHGRVVKWMAERTEPAKEATAIAIDDLHADYEVWCLGKNARAATLEGFCREFDRLRAVPELAGKIRKFGRRYYGIRLMAPRRAQLVSVKNV